MKIPQTVSGPDVGLASNFPHLKTKRSNTGMVLKTFKFILWVVYVLMSSQVRTCENQRWHQVSFSVVLHSLLPHPYFLF